MSASVQSIVFGESDLLACLHRFGAAHFACGALHGVFLVIPAKRADVKKKCQVRCGTVTTGFREFFYNGRIFRDFCVSPNFQSFLRSVVNQEEERVARLYISSATSQAGKTKNCRIKHAKETFWPAMPLGVGPAVFANRRDVKPISAGDECSLAGTELSFYRAALRPTTVLGRIEALQHRFHRWGKKSKINKVCFGGHVEAMKFCDDHCCELFANGVSRVPSPTFQKKFTTWKLGGRNACSCRAVRREIRAREAGES
jgi:hypothetical protein